MLGKLIKNEMLETYKVGVLMVISNLVITLMNVLSFRIPSWTGMFEAGGVKNIFSLIAWIMFCLGSLLLYFLMIMAVTYGVFIYQSVHFYRTMYTDRGYLTFTLPVKNKSIFNAKLLVGGFWMFLTQLLSILSVVVMVFSVADAFLPGPGAAMKLWKELPDMIHEFTVVMGPGMQIYFVVMLFLLLFGPFIGLATVFGCLTIGQLSRRHKGLMGVLTYIGVLFSNSILGMIIGAVSSVFYMQTNLGKMEGYMAVGNYLVATVLLLIVGIAMYCTSIWILNHKLNLE